MRRASLMFAAIAALTLALAPGLADARAGFGRSFGSRGGMTWSAPPSTSTAPLGAQPMQRSITPNAASPAYGAGSPARGYGARSGFTSGLVGGLIGAGLAGLLLGHGFWGGTMGFGGFLGFLLQILLLVLLVPSSFGYSAASRRASPAPAQACSPAPDLPASVQQAQAATRRNRGLRSAPAITGRSNSRFRISRPPGAPMMSKRSARWSRLRC